jgi:hypothetical protein
MFGGRGKRRTHGPGVTSWPIARTTRRPFAARMSPAGLPDDARHVLLRIDRLPSSTAPINVSRDSLQALLELAPIVEAATTTCRRSRRSGSYR